MAEFRRCIRCVLDNRNDPTMTFDENGCCNYCTDALLRKVTTYFPNEEGQKKLEKTIEDIKEKGKGKKYDCIMGLSGGVDSSYLAYLGHKWGLRVLAIHINDGFDTEITNRNLEKLIKALDFDFKTVTPDATQFNALTKAYMKAGVANLAAPQDSILFAFLFDQMRKEKINYFVSGWNFAGESIMQGMEVFPAGDDRNIRDIHKIFGTEPIDKLKLLSYKRNYIYRKIYGHNWPMPLNYINYDREKAFAKLGEFCGFEYYGRKHLENILTAFVQLYWFPKKFNIDKRTSHLSSMIVSGQITREEALKQLEEPLYENKLMDEYITFIKNKLDISDSEFDKIMAAPTRSHYDFKTNKDEWFYKIRHLHDHNK